VATSVTALSATVNAGTAQASPAVIALAVGAAFVDKIRWRVPPGPNGHLGWYLSMGGVQVLPDVAGEYVVANDEYDDWTISGLPDSGAWQLTGYNTGTYNHTVYLYFFTTPVQAVLTSAGGNLLAGFPSSEAAISTMFLQ
jgi:hypothetical protein